MEKRFEVCEILKAKKCGDLFSNDEDKAKEEYKSLVKMYHPDVQDGDNYEVFQKINELYEEAKMMFSEGRWEKDKVIVYKEKDSTKRRTIKYLKQKSFELGKMYISSTVITYVLDSKNEKYYKNMINAVSNIRYANLEMEKEFSKYVPNIIDKFESCDDKFIIVLKKVEDAFCLEDIKKFYDGSIPDRHAAWIMSRLCNLACFLDYNNLSHNGISLDNVFISPKNHSAFLYGGWWYCIKVDEKMIGTKKEIYDVMVPIVKTSKMGAISTDLESVKLIGRTITDKDKTPESFNLWLDSGSARYAVDEFNKWNTALDKSYGERRFVVMDIKENDIYND